MNIELTCQKCDGSFELDAEDLLDGSEPIECPHCEAKATKGQTEDFSAALQELQSQLAVMNKKFAIAVTMESDDAVSRIEADDDEDEPEDDEDDTDDLDEDDELDDDDEDAEEASDED